MSNLGTLFKIIHELIITGMRWSYLVPGTKNVLYMFLRRLVMAKCRSL